MIPITEGYRWVLINAGTVATNLLAGRGNRYTFTAYTEMDVDYTRPWFEWMDGLGAVRPRRVALLTLRNPLTLGVRRGAPEFAATRGMAVVLDEIYDPSTTDSRRSSAAPATAGRRRSASWVTNRSIK